ncbi:MAG: 6-carboxytetrahydropterin synthase [Myxococcaceae bacterium]|nr:6-carboxytetrahydropterin synthase [Myxococcaceae bacterium]
MKRHRIFVGKDVHKFSSAHMSLFPDGSKERIHGHNFRVSVSLVVKDTRVENMVDFALLKSALVEQCREWDQRLLLPAQAPSLKVTRQDATETEFTFCGKRYVVPADEVTLLPMTNVVVETLAEGFARAYVKRLGAALRPGVVEAVEVTVTESEGQGGVFEASLDELIS